MTTTTLEKPRCPKCGSTDIRTLRRTSTSYCRVCGKEWPGEEA